MLRQRLAGVAMLLMAVVLAVMFGAAKEDGGAAFVIGAMGVYLIASKSRVLC